MKLKMDISPDLFKLVIGLCGFGLIVLVWNSLGEVVHDMSFQDVRGEQPAIQVNKVSPRTNALPIAEASVDKTIVANGVSDDQQIQDAFSPPAHEPDVPEQAQEAIQPVKMSLVQQLWYTYKPQVQGLGGGGAFIQGQFWAVGESLVTMPMTISPGVVGYPKIESINKAGVLISIGSERFTLPTDGVR